MSKRAFSYNHKNKAVLDRSLNMFLRHLQGSIRHVSNRLELYNCPLPKRHNMRNLKRWRKAEQSVFYLLSINEKLQQHPPS